MKRLGGVLHLPHCDVGTVSSVRKRLVKFIITKIISAFTRQAGNSSFRHLSMYSLLFFKKKREMFYLLKFRATLQVQQVKCGTDVQRTKVSYNKQTVNS